MGTRNSAVGGSSSLDAQIHQNQKLNDEKHTTIEEPLTTKEDEDGGRNIECLKERSLRKASPLTTIQL